MDSNIDLGLKLEETNRTLEISSVVGIVAGFALMIPAFFVADLAYLAMPGLAVLVPSLLYTAR